ncbi:MAG: RagB/SusD family nutrient uptake outer membrane protein [Cytophagales bacterium]|nr:MAG: RagB/SusD family nutrient uptake outer membrane protein [Cytophagales bacterium]
MKNTFLYIAILLLGLTSCDDRLNINPLQTIDAGQALSSEQDLQSAIIGAYGQLGNAALYGTNFNLLAELQAAEDYITWRGTFQGYREVATKTMTFANSEANRTWINGYQTINTVNNVLANLDKTTGATTRSQIEGEALFIRGILFFELVRYYAQPWGATATNSQPGLPLVLTPSTTVELANTQVPRSTVAQTYAQAIDDLTKAASLLPADNGTRADKFSALAFLSRVYLQQADYAKALDAANQVIASGSYRLNPGVSAVFRNRNTAESIFEIQQNDQNNAGSSNDGLTTFYGSVPIDGSPLGRGDVQINTSFVNSFSATDARRTELLYIGFRGTNRYYSGKFTNFGDNIPVIRLAELLLIRAECNLRLNSATGATPAADLNAVRTRANLAPIATPTLADVLQERVYELAFEGLRIHDVKRLRQTLIRRNADGTEVRYPWTDPNLVLPIPKREIDVNPAITQNEGY